ncbi:hypothetical protein CAPTEDRAFT_211823, partial [Capitella teleta]
MDFNASWDYSFNESTDNDLYTYESYESEMLVFYIFAVFVLPVVIFFGIIGNLMTFVVLQTKTFKNSSIGFVLSALMIFDTLFLLFAFVTGFLQSFEMNPPPSQAWCKTMNFLNFLFPQVSAWSLGLLTAERLVIVVNPVKARQFCSRNKLIAAWTVIFVVICALNLHIFWTVTMGTVTFTDPDMANYEYAYCKFQE